MCVVSLLSEYQQRLFQFFLIIPFTQLYKAARGSAILHWLSSFPSTFWKQYLSIQDSLKCSVSFRVLHWTQVKTKNIHASKLKGFVSKLCFPNFLQEASGRRRKVSRIHSRKIPSWKTISTKKNRVRKISDLLRNHLRGLHSYFP